jgi:hypothetical protein
MKPTTPSATALLAIYDGRDRIGFVLSRGKLGFELFGRDEQSRGLFTTQELAIASLSTAGVSTWPR